MSGEASSAMEKQPAISSQQWSKYYATTLMCLTVAFLFADQNLLAPNLTRIAREFKFSDQMRDDK